ncbi:MAG TPA: CvpA family protein [Thermohalobaculum sp.]|nr:CvpA family protein [Thermohalobaculum sp.]
MEFTFVDGAVALIIILSGVLAYSRGLTRELFAILGWIAAAIAALYFAPAVEPLMHEIPGVGDFFASSCVISTIAAFTLIVAACLLILSVFTPFFAGFVADSALGFIDKILGFVFGVLRGLLLIAVAFLVFTNLSAEETIPQLETAATRPLMEESAAAIEDNLPESVPAWFGDRIDALMLACRGGPAPEDATSIEGVETEETAPPEETETQEPEATDGAN